MFISFKNNVENLLDHKTKVLRSNGGGEFTSSIFKKYSAYVESLINSLALTHQNKMVYLSASTGILLRPG